MKYDSLQDAVAFAEFAHRKQLDKSGAPYIEHPKRVLAAVQAQGVRPYVQIAAVMHDVVEDTPFTCEMLLELGFSEPAVYLIDLLTRRSGVEPLEYYSRIKVHEEAKLIKLADIGDNLQEWRLSYLKPETQARLRAKYRTAVEILTEA